MNNYIRACFCTSISVNVASLEKINKRLESHGCIFSQKIDGENNDWHENKFSWTFNNRNWEMRLTKFRFVDSIFTMVSFDVEENFFFQKDIFTYTPNNSQAFDKYIQLVNEIIIEIQPLIGIIDYEADLLCGSLLEQSFIAWGLFVSRTFIEFMDDSQVSKLFVLANDRKQTKNNGYIFFNHPLGLDDNTINLSEVTNIIHKAIHNYNSTFNI